MPTIIVTDVKNSKLSDFMNTRFGNMAESAISFAREFTKSHLKCFSDEIWDYHELSNGAFLISPRYDGERIFTYEVGNWLYSNMNAETFGIVVTHYVLCKCENISWKNGNRDQSDEFLKQIDLLKDYAATLPKDIIRKITPMFY